MLKKLRWKFTLLSMLAVCIVLFVLVACIYLAYRHITLDGIERTLTMLAENGGRVPPEPPRPNEASPDPSKPPPPDDPQFTPETPFETRFFAVWENTDEKQMDFIASVTGEDAVAFYRCAEASGRDSGFIGQYRFRRAADDSGTFYVFLDCTRQLRSMQNLLRASVLVTFAAILIIFWLIWLLSGKAIEPTVRGMERQKRFITDASHEIKTPLTVIRSYAEVMCMEDAGNEWAQGIQKESERLSHLVSNLVLLSRWDEEAPITESRAFDVSRSLWDTLTPYRNLAEAKGKRLEASIDEGLTVSGDESAIQTAFATLLENAVQYSLPDSTISFSAHREKRHIIARLTNRCELPDGLDPERLFDRFYRADASRSRSTGGSGIGLSITRAIIEAHRGTVSAQRTGEHELSFTVRLPV